MSFKHIQAHREAGPGRDTGIVTSQAHDTASKSVILAVFLFVMRLCDYEDSALVGEPVHRCHFRKRVTSSLRPHFSPPVSRLNELGSGLRAVAIFGQVVKFHASAMGETALCNLAVVVDCQPSPIKKEDGHVSRRTRSRYSPSMCTRAPRWRAARTRSLLRPRNTPVQRARSWESLGGTHERGCAGGGANGPCAQQQ